MSFTPVMDPEALGLLLGINGGTAAPGTAGATGPVPSPGLGGVPPVAASSGRDVNVQYPTPGDKVQQAEDLIAFGTDALRSGKRKDAAPAQADTYAAPAPAAQADTYATGSGKDYNGGYGQSSKTSGGSSPGPLYDDASSARSAGPATGGGPNFYPVLPMSPIRRKILGNLAAAGTLAQWPQMNWRPDMAPMFTSGAFGPLAPPADAAGFPDPSGQAPAAPAPDQRTASTMGMGKDGGFPGSPPPVWPGQPSPQTGLPPLARMGGAAPPPGGGFSRQQLGNLLGAAKRQQGKNKKKGGK